MDEAYERPLKVSGSCNIAAGVIHLSGREDDDYIRGSILSNPKLSWVSCGPRLTTLNNDDGSKRTGWTFGWALGEPSYKVVCVEEFNIDSDSSPILLVACDSEAQGSTLCFYHSGSSRVLKAVHFTEKISSVAVISKANYEEERISKLLKVWKGVVAVGTSSGNVYLLDAWWDGLQKCIEDCRHRSYDEQKQSKVVQVSMKNLSDNAECKTSSIRHGSSTLALWLNEETLQRGRSGSHPGVQNILGRMPREYLTVTALKYFPQIGTLAVGYNTSCFQLWDLSSLRILYTSALLEAMLPVHSFGLLEPSDDPRFVCYLWSLHHSDDEDTIPFAGMYILNYREKLASRHNSLCYYKGFSSCSIRYQLDLGAEIDNVVSGRIISCQTIFRSNPKTSPVWLLNNHDDNTPEECSVGLLAIAWEVWTANQLTTYQRLTVFDLNQWYREYMPQSSDTECSHYMTHFCLPEGPTLDVKVIPHSVRLFVTLQPVDEHFYPSAMSFKCVCLHHSHIVSCQHVSLQEECLQAVKEAGPSGLLLPARLYKMCLQASIKPLLVDIGSPSAPQNKEQREYLLSIALEYRMTQYLRNCVRDWSDGSHAVAGCTLPSLLHWAWGRVEKYKKWLDRLCVPLFDYSGTALDNNDLGLFHHMICQLHSLFDLFNLVLEKYHNCIIQGNYEQQRMAINLVTAFYDSVLWCIRNKVLPETNVGDLINNEFIPYFTEKIITSTVSRRAELHHVAKSLKHPVPASGLLLIDAVISVEGGGNKLTDQWEREGGTVTIGRYPPPSVQSLLRTYLVRDIPAHVKHYIVTYFLHDLIDQLKELNENTKERLLKYPVDFGLTDSHCRIIEAFWCLDHKQYEEGVNLLLDSCVVKEDLQVYHHRTIICILVSADKHKLALHYLNICRPGLIEEEDIKMKMTLLLVNHLFHEAFQFQRHHHMYKTELLRQFFEGCVEAKKLDIVFKLPLNSNEEESFMAYLEKTSHPQADDLRVLYLLSRSRYIEAIDVNEKLRAVNGSKRSNAGLPLGYSPLGSRTRNLFGPKDQQTGAPTRTVLTTRDLIVNSVAKSLPSVTRELADYCSKEKTFSWKQVNRPSPLSVVVHTDLSSERLPFYKAGDLDLVQAAVNKTRETWAPLLATPAALKRKLCSTVEDTPFLRTPVMPRFNNSESSPFPDHELRAGVRSRMDDDPLIAFKRARLELSSSAEPDRTERDQTFNKSMDIDITCPESLALLHTPHVAKVVKGRTKDTATPQSILKSKSNANTPSTPKGDKILHSAVNRQIRFSLPKKSPPPPSISPTMEDEEDDKSSPTVSPRKSIHEISSIQNRKGTPANPRISRSSFRNVMMKLDFDDETTTVGLYSGPTETNLNKDRNGAGSSDHDCVKESTSPGSSEDAYLSFQSTSSKAEGSRTSFQLPLGLEENTFIAEGSDGNNQNDQLEITDKGSVAIIESLSDSLQHTPKSKTYNSLGEITPETHKTDTTSLKVLNEKTDSDQNQFHEMYVNDVEGKSKDCLEKKTIKTDAEERKIIVEGTGSTFIRTPVKPLSHNTSASSVTSSTFETDDSDMSSENNDVPIRKHIWTEDSHNKNQRVLLLQEKDSNGTDKCLAKVAMTEDMNMFYLEPKIDSKICDKYVDLKKPTIEISMRANESQEQVKKLTDKESTSDQKDKENLNSESESNTNLVKSSINAEKVSKSEQVESIFNTSDSKTDSTPIISETKINHSPESNQLQRQDVSGSINCDINVSSSTSNKSILLNLDELVKRGRISMLVSPSTESISNIVNKKSNTLTDAFDISQQTSQNTKIPITSAERKELFHKTLPTDSCEIVDETSVLQTNSQKLSTMVNTDDSTVNKNNVSIGQSWPEENSRERLADADSQPKIETNTCRQGLQDESMLSKIDYMNVSTIVIESVGSLANISGSNNFEGNSAADFELKMSEDDSVLDSSNYLAGDVVFEKVEESVKGAYETAMIEENENQELTVEPLKSVHEFTSADELLIETNKQDHGDREEKAIEEENVVFETLKPVSFQDDENKDYLEDFDDQYDEDNQEYDDDVDVCGDIYGDLDDNKFEEHVEPFSEGSEQDNEDKSSDIVCLDSSSNESFLKKPLKMTTPSHRKSPEKTNRTFNEDDALDYEVDNSSKYDDFSDQDDDHFEDDNDVNDDNEKSSSLDSGDDDDSKKPKKARFSSDSDTEYSYHGNRSWKQQREDAVNDDCKENPSIEDDNTIESPPYELIGENSQSPRHHGDKVTDSCERNVTLTASLESAPLAITPCFVDIDKNKADIVIDTESQLNVDVAARSSVSYDNSSANLEPGSRSPFVNDADVMSDQRISNNNKSNDACATGHASQINSHTQSDTCYITETDTNLDIERECKTKNMLNQPNQSCNLPSSEIPILNVRNLNNVDDHEESDFVKLAENKRKKCLETGSILDLRNRRSKRYSSVDNLSTNKKLKNRRRSSSLHDLTSLIIQETKSHESLFLEQDRELYASPDCSKESNSNCPKEMYSLVEDTNVLNAEANQSVKTLPNVESMSTIGNSDITFENDHFKPYGFSESVWFPKDTLNEYYKKRVRAVATRLSSLQDISEEGSENISLQTSTLRRSVSTSQLQELANFEDDPPARLNPTKAKLSSEKMLDSLDDKVDMANVSKDNQTHSILHSNKSLLMNNTNVEVERRKQPSHDVNVASCNDFNEKQASTSSEIVSNVQERVSSDFTSRLENINRSKRAQSEPFNSEQSTNIRRSIRRRSSSLMKIEHAHKKLISRYSQNKRRSSRDSNFEPLKLVLSDEEYSSEAGNGTTINQEQTHDLCHNSSENLTCNNDPINDDRTTNQILEAAEVFESSTLLTPVEECQETSIPHLSTSNRHQRGQSEPPHSDGNEAPRPRFKRRSSSSSKINNIHKLLLPRYSLRKSVSSSNFKPLPIISNDEVDDDIVLNPINENIMEENSTNMSPSSKSIEKNSKASKSNHLSSYDESNAESQLSKHISTNVAKKRTRSKKTSVVDSIRTQDEDINEKPCTMKGNEEQGSNAADFNEERASKKSNVSKSKTKKSKLLEENIDNTDNDGKLLELDDSMKNDQFSKVNRNKGTKSVNNDDCKHPGANVDQKITEKPSNLSELKRKGKSSKSSSLLKEEQNIDADDRVDILPEKNEVTHSKKRKVAKKSVSSTDIAQSRKTAKQKKLENEEKHEKSISSISPISESQRFTEDHNLSIIDSPARRTRRSLSRASDTELLTPLQDPTLRRRTRRSGAMSDIVLSTPKKHEYAESEASDASTSSRLNTPTRRSMRIKSHNITPSMPEIIPEEYLVNRRLTRTQQSQLQKSFEASLINSPRTTILEDVPEESGENETDDTAETNVTSTPTRTSSRNTKKTPNPRKPKSKNKS